MLWLLLVLQKAKLEAKLHQTTAAAAVQLCESFGIQCDNLTRQIIWGAVKMCHHALGTVVV